MGSCFLQLCNDQTHATFVFCQTKTAFYPHVLSMSSIRRHAPFTGQKPIELDRTGYDSMSVDLKLLLIEHQLPIIAITRYLKPIT